MAGNLIDLTTDVELKKLAEENKSSALVLDFWATWAEPCVQMNEVFAELANKHSNLKFIKIEAEKFPEISESFGIEAVPTFIIFKNGKVADRVNGANALELSTTVTKHAKALSFDTGKRVSDQPKIAPKTDLHTRLKELTNSSPVMTFIKGTPSNPKCGFSKQLISILDDNQVKFGTFNILSDQEVRQGLKDYSDWPTYPQVYINGEFVGGLDIVKEMVANGEFKGIIPT